MGEALNTRISDGILSEDVETAFLRHATGGIRQDLAANTLIQGEALPSIAAVSMR